MLKLEFLLNSMLLEVHTLKARPEQWGRGKEVNLLTSPPADL